MPNCRNCDRLYDPYKTHAEFKGYCSLRCQHEKAKKCGYKQGSGVTEYVVLLFAQQLGDQQGDLNNVSDQILL